MQHCATRVDADLGEIVDCFAIYDDFPVIAQTSVLREEIFYMFFFNFFFYNNAVLISCLFR